MLENGNVLLKKALNNSYAIPQFNINNLEWTKYILEECEKQKSPVILGVSEGAIKHIGGYKTVYNIVSGLKSDLNISIPIVLHLDHGSSFDSCKKAIDNGFTSVMIDASMHEIVENIDITKMVVDYAHERNVSVEAEIGHIGKKEENLTNDDYYAKVSDCIKLKDETNIDSLAPALGSVHGLYKGEPNLNFDRMEEIKEALGIPLVLHGGTGIPDDKILEAIKHGIAKININTELQIVWSKEVRLYLKNNQDVYDPRKIISSGEKAMKERISKFIKLLKSNNKV